MVIMMNLSDVRVQGVIESVEAEAQLRGVWSKGWQWPKSTRVGLKLSVAAPEIGSYLPTRARALGAEGHAPAEPPCLTRFHRRFKSPDKTCFSLP
jgi:hypothetical protein